MERVAGILLADERSSAFEGPLQLQPLRGVPLLAVVLAEARTWPVDELFVVLGADADGILDVIDFEGSTVIINPEWVEGIAASVRASLDYLVRRGGFEVAVFSDGSTPGVSADVVGALLAAFGAAGKPAAVPKYRYSLGEPTVVGRDLWSQLLGREGTEGVRQLLAAHPEWSEEVWFDRLAPRKITSPMDLASNR